MIFSNNASNAFPSDEFMTSLESHPQRLLMDWREYGLEAPKAMDLFLFPVKRCVGYSSAEGTALNVTGSWDKAS